METHNVLNHAHSGSRSGLSCITATLKVLNDIICATDNKEYCVAAFVDLAKAFDSMGHEILLGMLRDVGLSENSLAWLTRYCSGLPQSVRVDFDALRRRLGLTEDYLSFFKVVLSMLLC